MTLRVGFLGYGFMGDAHASALARLPMFFPEAPDVERRVLVGRDQAAAADAADRLGFDETTDDWEAAIEAVDVLYNLGPNHLHADPSIAALERDVHVLCEKPLATDVETAERMAEAAAASDAVAALKIEKAAPRLYALLENRDQPEDVRLAALKTLGGLGSERIGDAIGLALDDENEALRKEARRILAGLKGSGEAAVAALRAALNKGTLREKQSALETLGGMGNEAANEVLAERMRKLLEGALSPALRLDVFEAAREAAENSEKLADLVQEYESSLPEDDPLAEWRVALRGGDPEAGKEIVFEHVSAQCLRCHQIEGEGGEVAPDLTTIAERRDRPYMLVSLIRPAAEIAEGYAMVTLTLDNGETVAGTLGEETNSHVTVQLLSGEKQKVKKSEIASRQSTQASAMPPMGSILDKQQVRDVIAYLSTLK